MWQSRREARREDAPLLAVFLLVAIAVGAAAAFLVGAPVPAAPGSPLFGPIPFELGLIIFGSVGAVLVLVWFFLSMGDERVGLPKGPAAAAFSSAIVIALLIIFLSPLAHSTAPSSPPSGTPPPPNGTPPPNPGNPPGGPGGGSVPPWSPGWIPWIVLGGAAVAVVLFFVPYMLRRYQTGLPPEVPADAARQAGLTQAIGQLDSDPHADPRVRILRVYAQLLERVAPTLKRLDALTAREVAAHVLSEWRVPPEAARTLTDLFEEARYSTHPMTESAVGRARAALQESLRAIDRPRSAA